MRENTGGLKLVTSPSLFLKVLVIVKEIWLMCFLSFSREKNVSNLSLNDLSTRFILIRSLRLLFCCPDKSIECSCHLRSTYDKALLLFVVVVCLYAWGGATGMWCCWACVYKCVNAWHPIQSNVETDGLTGRTEDCIRQTWKMTLAVRLSCWRCDDGRFHQNAHMLAGVDPHRFI